jgi:hypothetical protein
MLAIDMAGTYLEIQLLYTGSLTPGEICYKKVYWLAKTDPCIADSSENQLSPLKRLILMAHTTKVILPWSHWEVYWLAFVWRRGAVFHCQGASQPYLMTGLDRIELDRKDRLIITV